MSRLVSSLRGLLSASDGAAEVRLLQELRALLPAGASLTPRRLDGALVMLDVRFGPPSHTSVEQLCALLGVDAPASIAAERPADDQGRPGAQLFEITLTGLLIVASSEGGAVNDMRALPLRESNGYSRVFGSAAAQHAETADLMTSVLGAGVGELQDARGGHGDEN